ncbi:MAG: hypothetical protein LBK91_01465 [Synergistaceae bacterium]|jgi:hypothetical protein|nr:hypothetical protein [Synergistaceae bacterium]
MIIVTNARDRKEYSGPILGILEKKRNFYAALNFGDNHIILRDVSKDDLPMLKALIGQENEITNDNECIKNTAAPYQRSEKLERNREWGQ